MKWENSGESEMDNSHYEWAQECNYISIATMAQGKLREFNNDTACFRRYCEMQRNAAEKAGFHDTATYIQECIDDLKE